MTPIDEFAHDARTWARQTVIFTLQFGLTGAKTAVDEQAQVVKASDESLKIMTELWAMAERGSTNLAQTAHKFVRLVLEWSADHLPKSRVCGRSG